MPKPPQPDPTGIAFVDEAINKVVKKYEGRPSAERLEALRETLATVVMTSPEGSQIVEAMLKRQVEESATDAAKAGESGTKVLRA